MQSINLPPYYLIHSFMYDISQLITLCRLFSRIFLLINPNMVKCMSREPLREAGWLYFQCKLVMSGSSSLSSGRNSYDSIGLDNDRFTRALVPSSSYPQYSVDCWECINTRLQSDTANKQIIDQSNIAINTKIALIIKRFISGKNFNGKQRTNN